MKSQMYKIEYEKDREALLVAFGNSGYKVRVLERQDENCSYPKIVYFVEVSK